MFLLHFLQVNIQIGRYNLTQISNWSICNNSVYDWNPLIQKVWCMLPSKYPWHDSHHDLNDLSKLRVFSSDRCGVWAKVSLWPPSFHNPPYICSSRAFYNKHGWIEGLDSTSHQDMDILYLHTSHIRDMNPYIIYVPFALSSIEYPNWKI